MQFNLFDGTQLNTREIVSSHLKGQELESFDITCFRVYGLREDYFLQTKYKVFNLVDNHLYILAYLKEFQITGSISMKISEVGSGFRLQQGGSKQFNAGSYLLLVYYGKESVKQLKNEYASLISIFTDEEFLYEECFNTQVMSKGFVQRFPIEIKKQNTKISPDELSMHRINKVINLINERGRQEKDRMMLSLSWYYKHLNQKVEDAFLTLWIAIEILGDCNGSNVGKIKKAFQTMYNFNSDDAGQIFGIGMIQSIRGKLVHNGRITKIDKVFIEYLRRIYWDLLLYGLNEECKEFSLKYLRDKNIQVSDYLTK